MAMSIIANNSLEYDEKVVSLHLERIPGSGTGGTGGAK